MWLNCGRNYFLHAFSPQDKSTLKKLDGRALTGAAIQIFAVD